MKYYLVLITFFTVFGCFAQHEQDNWLVDGDYIFRKVKDSLELEKTGVQLNLENGPASYSDPQTGELMLFVDGSKVYNKMFVQMPNGFNINGYDYGYVSRNMIVPNPQRKHIFYIINSSPRYNENRLFITTVDMNMEAGLGDVIEKTKLISDSVYSAICVVKQLYNQGYWLITHTPQSNEFKSYRIGINGIEANPVVSYAGSRISESYSRFSGQHNKRGKMISNSTGDRFVMGFSNEDTFSICEEFFFDKGCGIVSFKQAFVLDDFSDGVNAAYSSNDSVLYVKNVSTFFKRYSIVQYDLSAAVPSNARTTIVESSVARINYGGEPDLQLGPDGKLYFVSESYKDLDCVQFPNRLGDACGFKRDYLNAADGLFGVRGLPQFIMDEHNPISPAYAGPTPIITGSCIDTSISFALKDYGIFYDSSFWDVGNTIYKSDTAVIHHYQSDGDYYVSFNWYLCGHRYSLFDTIRLRTTPRIRLGNDTNLCEGKVVILYGPDSLDEYKWSTGAVSRFIVVEKSGKYSLKVKNANCESEGEIDVNFAKPMMATLGNGYTICDDQLELVKLDAGEGFDQYKWTPTGDTTQWIIVGDLGDYFVMLKDFNGCTSNDDTRVERRCPVSVFYPNAFTPNDDGVNDVFLPVGSDVVNFTIEVYNAWGQRVFESNDLNKGWDGKVKGVPSPSGTYFYKSAYSGYRNKRPIEFVTEGNITLLR